MLAASKQIQNYFKILTEQTNNMFEIASKAKEKGIDASPKVEVKIAKNMNERVEGLISFLTPQTENVGIPERIEELKEIYGKQLSLELAMDLSKEVASEKFCKFNSKKEAIETGIRTAFAYYTAGIVSVPLDGFIELHIKKRQDGKEYLSALFGGPIRSAGGTAIIIVLLIIDYLRQEFGFEKYDPTSQEVKRIITEMDDYDKIIKLQYKPSEKEVLKMLQHIPIEISGDPTEKMEVSNFKDLERIDTNKLRGGVCLVYSSLALKSQKITKELDTLKQRGLNWDWMNEFIKLQKEVKSKQEKKTQQKGISPDWTYLADLAAGRPVLAYPLEKGGFRIRYGRTRYSGFSTDAIHPASMIVLEKYIATGTQLKVERPGKSAGITPCDTIEPPIILFADGSVQKVSDQKYLEKNQHNIKKILFLGDILINFGDFLDRGQQLVPAGYCEEWYSRDLEEVITTGTVTNITPERLKEIIKTGQPTFEESITLSQTLKIPLAPNLTHYWNMIAPKEFKSLLSWLATANNEGETLTLQNSSEKTYLEKTGFPHLVVENKIIIENNEKKLISFLLEESKNKTIEEKENTVSTINSFCSIETKDKLGTFLGARMGRPEKSKMRKMKGSPHGLFPVGEDGGRMKTINKALEVGQIFSDFAIRSCTKCKSETIYEICETCFEKTKRMYYCRDCGLSFEKKCDHFVSSSYRRPINIKKFFDNAINNLGDVKLPELFKGIKGLSGENKIPEYLGKGLLRAKHKIYVNKDGTTRYDLTEMPVTHFKLKEINVSVEKIKELGYGKDIHGNDIIDQEQVIEIMPQDIILPANDVLEEEKADDVFFKITKCLDESLQKIYKQKPYYNLKNKEGLIGQLIIALAPHTSAGMLGRIIGFSQTQVLFAHPSFHSALRRDTDGDEAGIMLVLDAFLNFSREYLPNTRGARTMDIPLTLTPNLDPAEVDDMVYRLDIAWKYPKELYLASQNAELPFNIKIPLLGETIGTEKQYESLGFTNEVLDLNNANPISSYKVLPTMIEKIDGQMSIAKKLNCVDEGKVATLLLEKHLIKDLRGNLRKFSTQTYRCSGCNEKYRRPPLIGCCRKCKGRLIYTVSEGSITKYLEHAIKLKKDYQIDGYTDETIDLIRTRIKNFFGTIEKSQTKLTTFS